MFGGGFDNDSNDSATFWSPSQSSAAEAGVFRDELEEAYPS
jgi:hypothetical protein